MSRDASVTIAFGDGEYVFRLALGQLRELQEKTDAGPAHLLDRLRAGLWRVDDVRETIRLGLIGGGMAPAEALKRTVRYVDERPWLESVPVAMAALIAALVGAGEEDQPGKPEPAGETGTASPMDASASPASTGAAA